MKIAIIGKDGYIGSHLYKKCLDEGIDVVGTSHHKSGDEIFFELGTSDEDAVVRELNARNVSYAVISAGITNIKKCYEEREYTYNINVNATKKLIGKLYNKGIKSVFLSSDVVFDGIEGNYMEDAEVNPLCEYGRQKAEVEKFILNNMPENLIYRLSKQYDINLSDRGLIADIYRNIESNGIVRNIKGLIFNPTYVEDTINAIILGIKLGFKGLYHVASPNAISRYDFAKNVVSALGYDTQLVIEEDYKYFGLVEEKPLNTSLNVNKFITETGFEFCDFNTLIKEYRFDR